MSNMTSDLAIRESWIGAPIQIVPFSTISPLAERIDQWKLVTSIWSIARHVATNRILRLEFLVATAIVGFGCFASKTLAWENALQQASADQARSIAKLGTQISRQDQRISDLNRSLNQASRDLAAQVDALRVQVQAQQKQMGAISSRLHSAELALRPR